MDCTPHGGFCSISPCRHKAAGLDVGVELLEPGCYTDGEPLRPPTCCRAPDSWDVNHPVRKKQEAIVALTSGRSYSCQKHRMRDMGSFIEEMSSPTCISAV